MLWVPQHMFLRRNKKNIMRTPFLCEAMILYGNYPTFALMAAAKACRNSFVFSGSCPATIFAGRADKDFPVATPKMQNMMHQTKNTSLYTTFTPRICTERSMKTL